MTAKGVRLGIAMLTAAMVATGCGVRRSETDVAAAARGGVPISATSAAGSTAAGDTALALASPEAVVGDTTAAVSGDTATSPGGSAASRAPAVGSGAATSPALPTVRGAAATTGSPGSGSGPSAGPAAGGATTGTNASSPAPGSPGATPGGAQVPNQALSPVRIGNVSTFGGVVGSTLGDALTATTAWAKYINDHGGLNGHPVELFTADDGGDPARHRALTQQLHEEKHVIAFINPVAPLSSQGAVDYVDQKHIPVIGDVGGSTWAYGSPMYFPQLSTGEQLVTAWVGTAKRAADESGKKKLAYVGCTEAQVCRDGDKLVPQLAPKFGLEVVYKAQTSVAQPDFTSECLGARNAGAEILVVISDTNSVIRTVRSCKQIDFNPIVVTQHATGQSILSDPNMDGTWIGAPLRAFTATGLPALDDFKAQMSKYAPKAMNVTGELGWTSGKLFELAAKNLPEPPTTEALLEGLWQIHDETLGGFTYPLTFVKDKPPVARGCWFPVQIKDKAPVDRSDGRTDCLQ